jgi:hypothetical protein
LIALQRARVEAPAEFTAFQGYASSEPTSAQRMRRAPTYKSAAVGIAKSAPSPSPTWEDLVSQEIAKSAGRLTEEIASVRTLQKWGGAALTNRMIQKCGPTVARQFAKAASEIMYQDGTDRCESLRRLRLENPAFYKALQRS